MSDHPEPRPGHVFVVQGDLTRLASDAVLVPTDCWRVVEPYWGRWATVAVPDWEPGLPRVSRRIDVEHQIVRYLDVGAEPGASDVDWLQDGVHQGLRAAVGDLVAGPAPPRHGRARPLLTMPAVGVGAGGYGSVRGAALRAVVDSAKDAARQGLDVAIVCLRRADYAALQSLRVDGDWASGLSQHQLSEADDLGRAIQNGSVAMFLGAGVSKAAGLPDWAELLGAMASEAWTEAPLEFTTQLAADPPRAASLLQAQLGTDAFRAALRSSLQTEGYAVGHALIASLRIGEVVTTNVDDLYERACTATFGPTQLSVLPWGRKPGRPPWLLKLHGDLSEGDMVFTHEDYESFDEVHGVLGAVVQSLLVTRNLVFVGYSMRDENFLRLADEVAAALRRSGAPHREIGTVLSLVPVSSDHPHRVNDVRPVLVGDDDPVLSAEDARQLELFLDRMAWTAARDETSWVLDHRYKVLLTPDRDAPAAEALRALPALAGPVWTRLRELLADYGLKYEPE